LILALPAPSAADRPHRRGGAVYYFGYPKLMGFSGTVQYMASSGAPMPTLAAIIAILMEVPAAILIVLGFFTRPLAVIFIFYTLGTAVIGHHYWDMTGDAVLAEHD
jgi:putative oxidoreductase